jgi:hypothetical protein
VDKCPPDIFQEDLDYWDEDLTYGGCITQHFGHWIAEFIHRILPSLQAFPSLRILFIGKAGETRPLPSFVEATLAYLGVPPEKVRVVHAPVRVRRLHVFAQQERLQGPAPQPEYLSALAALQKTRWPEREPLRGTLFVSRSRQRKGLAGEAILDQVFAAAGAEVYFPEEHRLTDQLDQYQAQERLLFSEGSALHALQLLGEVAAEVTVLSRRAGHWGLNFLAARVRNLDHIPISSKMLAFQTPDGTRASWSGLAFIDTAQLETFTAGYFPLWSDAERKNTLRQAQTQLGALEYESVRSFFGALRPAVLKKQGKVLIDELRQLRRFSEDQLSCLVEEFLSTRRPPG